MDQARKIVRDLVEAEPARSRPEAQAHLAADLDKVLRLTTPAKDARPEARREAPPVGRDWSPAIDMVRQAAAIVRESQVHMERMDAQARELATRAREEVKAAEMRAQAAEARAHAAETRAQAAEARAKEAEDWLRRLTDALHEEFGPARGAEAV